MAPTLTLGDKVLIDRSARKRIPKRGDIVAFSSPNDERWQLLRVVGLPGETIKVSGVEVSVDGKPLAEPYARYADKEPAPALDHSTAGREVRLAEDELFLLGDNRDRSYDGRVNGAIHRTYIKGIARTIYFSWNGDSVRVRWRRIGAIG
jgi:signal peptidase I